MDNAQPPSSGAAQMRAEALALWRAMPAKGLCFALLAGWVALFHWLGTSTLGYVKTPSLFGWWLWVQSLGSADSHPWFIPLVVLGLLWWRRRELIDLPKRVWWPALGILLLAIAAHVLSYLVQQSRGSIIAFFLGLYGLTGLLWGRAWLQVVMFPFALFVFCIPMGEGLEAVTLPLRHLATTIAAGFSQSVLGVNVIQQGTLLFDGNGAYQYEVAAACSGIRSLSAIIAFGVIYGYITFGSFWKRLLIISAAIPLAVVGNVFRLTLIIIAAEAFGQKAGNYVHESSWFSLAPYVPSIGGMLLLGWWLERGRSTPSAPETVPLPEAARPS
jgi:exosortase